MENDRERSSSSEEEVDVVPGQEETGLREETIQATINHLIAKLKKEKKKRKQEEALKEQEKDRAEQAEARAEQEKALKEQEKALRIGTFYSLISAVWRNKVVGFSEIDFEALRRKNFPLFYMSVITAAQEVGCEPCDESLSRSSCSSKSKSSQNYSTALKLRPAISFFRKEKVEMPGFEAAHLIPHSNSCNEAYIPLAEAACGVRFNDNIDNQQRVLMRGSKKKVCTPKVVPGAPTNNETVNPGNEQRTTIADGTDAGPPNTTKAVQDEKYRRKSNSGIKYSPANFVYTVNHCRNMDIEPSVLLLPIMTLEEVLNYQGEPYYVCFACSTDEAYVEFKATEIVELCNESELEKVTATLSQFCKGIAHVVCNVLETNDETENKNERLSMECVRNAREILRKENGVRIPLLKYSPELKVCKLKADSKGKAVMADPYLLYVKSTVCWSYMQEQKLLPGCSPSGEFDDCSSSYGYLSSSGGSSFSPPPIITWDNKSSLSKCCGTTMPEGLQE